jgi:H+/Cl- antiporter ClcA
MVARTVRWAALGALVGLLAGLASAAFLETLTWATRTRHAHPDLVYLLPVVGLATGLAYHYLGGRSGGGNALILDEIHDPKDWLPRRMAPLTYGFTVLGHLVGASVGREGTAIQMAGSLTDAFGRATRVSRADRSILLIAAIAGGFGSVFGVPFAGVVFAFEVQSMRRRRRALVPAVAASFVGDAVVRLLDVHHTPTPELGRVPLDPSLLLKLALAGLAFGLTARTFVGVTHALRRELARLVGWPPLRPALAGVAVLGLTGLVGNRAYLGLSLPLVGAALAGGAGVVAGAFALKALFTAVSLGGGFQGGEVTPLFVIGATLGVSLARLLDAPVVLLASVGFVAVFAGAANTPVACTVMAIELFGRGAAIPAAIACFLSFVVSAERGIYGGRRR